MKWLKHLHTVNKHRWIVMKSCFRIGLYKQGLLHDISKYSWTEFSVGAKYYQGNRSPNDMERREKGYSAAWLHHKGRNKHHIEYWIDYSLEKGKYLVGVKMPLEYVLEMFCDRVAACKTYKKEAYVDSDPYDYFNKSKEHYMIHGETKALLEKLLFMLKEEGEAVVFPYMRGLLREYKKTK